jgi:hypothetical protein
LGGEAADDGGRDQEQHERPQVRGIVDVQAVAGFDQEEVERQH